MKQALILEARREGYSLDQIWRTMTAGELIELLQQYDEDCPVYLSHDSGYTFGGIRENDFDWKDETDLETL